MFNLPQDLLVAACNDAPGARDKLWTACWEPLRRLIARRLDRGVQAHVDVSDIVQDTLAAADRRLNEFLGKKEQVTFSIWLRQIAIERAIDAYHRAHTKMRAVDKECRNYLDGSGSRSAVELFGQLHDRRHLTPASLLVREELRDQVRAALHRLEPNDREIIFLRQFESFSTAEIADMLGLTNNAVAVRYLRAMRRLRDVFDKPPQ